MKNSIFTTIKNSVLSAKNWYFDTPERALEEAYNAALRIKAIEDEYFQGNKISSNAADYGDSVITYFFSELKQNLSLADNRLREFQASSSFLNLITNQRTARSQAGAQAANNANSNAISARTQPSVTLEKLKFIDSVTSKYKAVPRTNQSSTSTSLVVVPQNVELEPTQADGKNGNEQPYSSQRIVVDDLETVVDKTGVLPRSIFTTINKIKRELDPESEQEVLNKYRSSKVKTAISLRFILTLIIAPLLTFQLCKLALVGPLVDKYLPRNNTNIFINRDLEEEAFEELKIYEEKIKFKYLISKAPKLSEEEIEENLKHKAGEIAEASRKASTNAIKNVFSDIISVIVFAVIIVKSRREIEILKSFMDDVVYGLSDSAKAFIIILFTDVFVGFHSPHGWEVLLEGMSRHLGIPENRDFIFLFIATFPVILDTVFKYWIFRYLNRISPSAVATYRNMNE